jgi:glycosyltransferase involved in cell wall biosynthesis
MPGPCANEAEGADVRVLQVVSSSQLAGTERHVIELAAALRRLGVEAEVACSNRGGGLVAALSTRGIPVHPLDLEGRRQAAALPRLAGLARGFDLVHAHLSRAAAASVAVRALVGRPVVETRHFLALAHETRSRARRIAGRICRSVIDQGVDLTIAPSRAATDGVPGAVAVVPHGIPMPATPRRTVAAAAPVRFITVGRLEQDRNHPMVLEAFAMALGRLPADATLTVVGDGERRTALEALRDQLGLGGRVRFTGWLVDPAPALAAASISVVTPYEMRLTSGQAPATEAFGIAALEAMAAGLPVIGAARGGLVDLIDDGGTGLAVEPDAASFADAMAELASAPGRCRELGEAARRRAHQDFTVERMAERTLECYRQVVGDGGRPKVLRVYHSAVVEGWRERDRELRRHGVELTLVAPRAWREGGRRVSLDPGRDTFVVPARTGGRHPARFAYDPRPLVRLMRRHRFDHVDVHEEPCSLAAAEVRLLRRWLQPDSKLLLYSAQNIPKRYPWPFRHFETAALDEAAGVYVCNQAAGQILRGKGFRGVLDVLPLGVDVERFTPAAWRSGREPSRELEVGYVGRLTPEKGVDVLLRAAAGNPRWRVRIVGDGPVRAGLERLAGELGVADRSRFVAPLDHAHLPHLYRELDVLAVPSLPTRRWVEQFCRVAVEAMASGVPIVASASGSLPEVVGDAGLLIPPGDPDALAAALRQLADEPERRQELGRRGRIRAARCSWAAVAAAHLALYQEVSACRSTSSS